MANFFGVFYSNALCRPVHFTAVLCNDNFWGTEENPHYKRPTKNVYLLHGYSGCDQDWFRDAPLSELANRFNVNFFMPNGENSFYVDRPATGFRYATFVGQEFIDYTRKTFGLSDKREDTFIGGLSMGGFGALHTGLMFNDTFSRIMAFSSALIVNGLKAMKEMGDNPMANVEYYEAVFGDLDEAAKTDHNPEVLVQKLIDEKKQIPEIYMACGTEDFLLGPNREMKAFFDSVNIPITYFEGPGVHDMVFWRAQLEAALVWALEK